MNRKFTRTALLAATVLLIGGFTAQVRADDHRPGDHDKTGYWDANHHHQPYSMHNNHRGFWDQRGGVRVFINVD